MTRSVGWLTLFLVGTDLFVMSPLLPPITRELGVPAADGGWAVTTFAAAYLVGGPTFGSLADRTSRHRVLAIGLAVFALANLATALVESFALLLAVRAVAGLAASGVTPSVYALVGSTAPPAKRARWLAVVTSGLLTALITGAPAGTLLADVVGWRGVFVVMAVAAVLILGVILAAGRARPAVPGPEAAVAAVPTLLRLRAVSVTALWALAVYGVYTYLGTILTTVAHMTSGMLAVALACFGVGALAGNLAGGRLTDRYGGRAVSIVSLSALGSSTRRSDWLGTPRPPCSCSSSRRSRSSRTRTSPRNRAGSSPTGPRAAARSSPGTTAPCTRASWSGRRSAAGC